MPPADLTALSSVLLDAGVLACAVIFLITVNELRSTRRRRKPRDIVDVDLVGARPRKDQP